MYEEFDLIWDGRIREYHKYLKSIKSQTPTEVMRLASKISLHDGEIVGITKSRVTVWLDEVLYSIEFDLDTSAPQPRHLPTIAGHPFDTKGRFWLYDELELISPGLFQFEILLSNGRILRFSLVTSTFSSWVVNTVRQSSMRSRACTILKPSSHISKLKELVLGPPHRTADLQKVRRIGKNAHQESCCI